MPVYLKTLKYLNEMNNVYEKSLSEVAGVARRPTDTSFRINKIHFRLIFG